jgi:hypothetical protein
MGWYERVVFNRLMEAVLDQPAVHEERRRALDPAEGAILDIGLGTGFLQGYAGRAPPRARSLRVCSLSPSSQRSACVCGPAGAHRAARSANDELPLGLVESRRCPRWACSCDYQRAGASQPRPRAHRRAKVFSGKSSAPTDDPRAGCKRPPARAP